MRKFLAFLLGALILASCASPADAGLRRIHTGGPAVNDCAQDGRTGAPTGATTLYSARRAVWAALAAGGGAQPACQVADVDYPVGPDNDCASCVSPDTATYPAGVAWNAASNRLICDGAASGAHIHHLDFTLLPGGGGGIQIQACNNVIIDNIKITRACANTPQPFPISSTNSATNITITKVWIDGGSVAGVCGGGSVSDGEVIYLGGSGLKTVTYSRVIHASEHSVTFTCPNAACTSYARYNSFSATGYAVGSHDNGVQWLGTFAGADESWNLWFNPQPSIADISRAACYGPQTCTNSYTGSTVSVPNGQLMLTVAETNQGSYLVDEQITGSGFTGTKYICALDDNYALSRPGGPDYVQITLSTTQGGCSAAVTTTTSTGTAQVQNVFPMGLVNPVRLANQAATGQFLNSVINNNVFDGDGPIKPGTNAISCGGDGTGLEVNGVTVNGNYWNPAGYQGGFWLKASFCINVSGTGNVRMDTGASLPIS